MAKTWQNLVDEARVILQDTEEEYRYSDAILLSKLNRGLQELGRLRPDAFWEFFNEDTDDIAVPEVVVTDADPDTDTDEFDATEDAEIALTANFNLPGMFYAPLVFFVASSAELLDDEFTQDSRAVTLMQSFKSMVISL